MDSESSLQRLVDWEQQLAELPYQVRCYATVGSTMDLARVLALELTVTESGLVVARQQLAGRGRRGKSWSQPEAGLYATFVFSSAVNLGHIAGLSLAVGVLAAEVLEEFGSQISLKWPNDLLTNHGEKLGGILIETVVRDGNITVLVGIGINLKGAPKGVGASSLSDSANRNVDATELLMRLSPALMCGWAEFLKGGFAAFKERFMARAFMLGMQVSLNHGETLEQGKFIGVSQDGALLLQVGDEILSRPAGEVSNVRAI